MVKPIHLGVELDGDGAHPAAWRFAQHPPQDLLTPRRLRDVVTAAERAGFTFATFEDAPRSPGQQPNVMGRFDAVQRAAFAGPLTGRIGLVPVTEVVYSEPCHLATQLASLDVASEGRAGWIVAASGSASIADAYGRPVISDRAALRQEASDVVEASRRLWDSWEDDAVIRDAATGRYLDGSKLHHVDFIGTSFSIKGPSIIPRPPQGQVVVIAPWRLVEPDKLDVALVSADSEEGVALTAGEARKAGVPLVVAELEIVLDVEAASGADRLEQLDAHTPWAPKPRLRQVGSAAELVHLIERLSTVVDGIRLHPAVLDIDLPELERAVLPALRGGGLAERPCEGASLRESLGLPRPINRYAFQAG